ncbi:MAG: HtaA domain-containing protein [Humibacter sp.]
MASLEWPIRRSLVEYVDGLEDGEVTLVDGAESSPDGFRFPSAGRSDDGVLRFSGSVVLTGYEGALTFPVVEPWIEPEDDAFQLTIQDPADPAARMRLVSIAQLESQPDRSKLGSGVTLATPGSLLLVFGPYVAGKPFDDLRITA